MKAIFSYCDENLLDYVKNSPKRGENEKDAHRGKKNQKKFL